MAKQRRVEDSNRTFSLRSEWKVFAWCFIISVVLWLLIALNELYTTNINVRVHYFNLPVNRIFERPLPEDLKVAVTAKGWDLMAYSFKGSSENINIDLEDYNRQRYILTRRIKVSIAQQISQKISVNDIYPDTILLTTSPKATKKIPVHVNYSVSFKKGYNLGDAIRYLPDSVILGGPKSLIENINSAETDVIKLDGLDKTVTVKTHLKTPGDKNISYSTSLISVDFPVFQLTEKIAEVPVEIINPNKTGIRLIPQKVSVTYQTTLNKYSQIDSRLFQAVVDGTSIDTTKKQLLKVQIVSQPKFTYNLRLQQEYVDYIINK